MVITDFIEKGAGIPSDGERNISAMGKACDNGNK